MKAAFVLMAMVPFALAQAVVAQTGMPSNVDSNISVNQGFPIPQIESIEQTQDGDKSIVRFRLNEVLSQTPNNFMVSNPSRIALDIEKHFDISGKKIRDLSSGLARTAAVITSGDKTRLVLNLRENVSYDTSIEGKDLVVTMRSVAASSVKDVKLASNASKTMSDGSASPVQGKKFDGSDTKKFSKGNEGLAHGLLAFDFRRGPSGEGRVLVDLKDSETGIDIKQQGRQLVVDFINASADPTLLKNMNVADFGTLVNSVSITKGPNGSRMTVEPLGDWEYNAYQADKRFVVEIKKRSDQTDGLGSVAQAGRVKFSGEKMSMNFQNADVRNLLNVIADFTKLNIVTSDSVAGKITVRLQDVPWDQALDIILSTRGLDMRRKDSVIWVAPRDEITGFEKKTLEAQVSTAELEPTKTESFLLNYATAANIASLLSNEKQRILSKRGSVVIDTRTNQLFVQDTASKLEEVSAIVKKVDIPVRQVLIEARIVEARDTWGQSLGAKLGVFNAGKLGNHMLLGASPGVPKSSTAFPNGVDGSGFSTGTPIIQQVNLPAQGLGSGASPSAFALTLLNSAATQFLSLEISAAEADGRGKIVSSPRVITANQEKALIEQGTELPYQQASASGATNVSFKKANLKLEVTPQITPDGNVIMSVDINKDAPGANTSAGFAIDTKHIQTKVLIENGGTVVIGGIYTQDERTDVDKVPFLGDLPALGNLFKSTVKKDSKTELLIFLTPKILDEKMGLGK